MDKFDTPREAWPGLMARAQAGDRQAYTQLLTALVPVIRTLVRKQIADDVLIEDVVQDVLLAIHRVRHTYSPDAPFLPWLMAITQARTVDALRRRGRLRLWETPEQECAIDSMALYESRDPGDELATFLNQLPQRQRQIVEHVHLREMSLKEAAIHNNLTVSAVKSLLHRALSNLRRFGASNDRS